MFIYHSRLPTLMEKHPSLQLFYGKQAMQCGIYYCYLFVLFCHRYPQHQWPSTRRKMLCSFVEQRTMQTTRSPLQCRCWIFVSSVVVGTLNGYTVRIRHTPLYWFCVRSSKLCKQIRIQMYVRNLHKIYRIFTVFCRILRKICMVYVFDWNKHVFIILVSDAKCSQSYLLCICYLHKTQIVRNGTKTVLTAASILYVYDIIHMRKGR